MKKTLTITIILLTFCLNNFAQDEIANAIENRSADEGKVESKIPVYKVLGNNLDYLIELVRPKLTLVFNPNREINVEDTKDIRKVLDSYWQNAIEYFYNAKIEKFPNAQVQIDKTLLWSSQNQTANALLQKESIEATNGKRNISKNEADEILAILNRTASEIIEKAKDVNGAYKNIKIKRKSFPKSGGKCQQDSGFIELMVTFDKSAKITEVEVLRSSGCFEFDQNAIRSDKEIKFEPAKTGDETITVSKKIVYNFTTY